MSKSRMHKKKKHVFCITRLRQQNSGQEPFLFGLNQQREKKSEKVMVQVYIRY